MFGGRRLKGYGASGLFCVGVVSFPHPRTEPGEALTPEPGVLAVCAGQGTSSAPREMQTRESPLNPIKPFLFLSPISLVTGAYRTELVQAYSRYTSLVSSLRYVYLGAWCRQRFSEVGSGRPLEGNRSEPS